MSGNRKQKIIEVINSEKSKSYDEFLQDIIQAIVYIIDKSVILLLKRKRENHDNHKPVLG